MDISRMISPAFSRKSLDFDHAGCSVNGIQERFFNNIAFQRIFLLWPLALGIFLIANASPVSMQIETLLQVRCHKG